jgi:uncharacterized protein (TIGR02145 family)
MKRNYLFLTTSLSLSIVCASCVNSISDNDSEVNGNIPIRITTSIQTRVNGTSFENGDHLGVFLLTRNQSLDTERYLDNIEYNSMPGQPVSGETLYYPAGNDKCTFISYYPYKANILSSGSNKMNLSVAADQTNKSDFLSSDLLVAKADNIQPSSNTVVLNHEHRLALLKIVIQPEAGTSTSELLSSNPTVTINNLYTSCKYNMDSDEFSDLSNVQNIVPNGSWSVEDGKLVGKSAVVIPQTIASNTKLFSLTLEGREFVCSLNDDLITQGRKISTVTIPCSKWGIGNVSFTITDWLNGNNATTSLLTSDGGIVLSALPFGQSKVCNVFHGNTIVAQICKEYLSSSNINASAIVYYPVTNGTADLTAGIVLQVMGISGVYGSTVSWNQSSNTLTYNSGSHTDVTTIYVDADQSVKLSAPSTSYDVNVSPMLLSDVRGTETKTYPVVKIGTQYWMADEISATKLNDGTSIAQSSLFSVDDTNASYFSQDGNVLYDYMTINSGKMAPTGWKIPTQASWQSLFTYIGNDISKLKTTDWNTEQYPATNITGFNATGRGVMGIRTGSTVEYLSEDSAVAYWYMSDDKSVLGRYTIQSTSTTATDGTVNTSESTSKAKGYCLRCVKESN